MCVDEGGKGILLPELMTVFILAFAVSMDAFSFAIGLGKRNFRLRKITFIAVIIGVFHIIMPILGMLVGHYLSGVFDRIIEYISGFILIALGISMLIEILKENNYIDEVLKNRTIIFLSFIISLDSFSAALSLGLVHVHIITATVMFGGVTTLLTWSGFLIGSKIKFLLGKYGELFGSFILIFLGVRLIIA